jgi:Xaa-Pro dipeptidase
VSDDRAPEGEIAQRRERLAATVAAAGLDGIVASAPHHIYYLTGAEPWPGAAAALLARGDRAVLVWPGDAPEQLAEPLDVLSYDPYARARGARDDAASACAEAARRLDLRGRRIGVDGAAGWVGGESAEAVFAALLRPKSPHELAVIGANLAANDRAFAAVRDRFGPGACDLDVFAWCVDALAAEAAAPVAYEGNIGMGAAGDYFDAQPCGAVAAPGASLFVDLYARVNHYIGDSTRTFSAGAAPQWLRDVHARLEDALDELQPLIRPGAVAGELDRRCRELLDDSVPGAAFPHHTGHGVGLGPHEAPHLVPGSRDVLRVGDVVAVEPGLYVPGVGGARLEEVYAVTDDGARPLTRFPRTLTECHATEDQAQ